MWCFTKRGFYSVVSHKTDSTIVVIRSRERKDLEELRKIYSRLKIIHTPLADYEYRAEVSKSLWCDLSWQLSDEINYTNFKDRVHEKDPERASLYLKVWEVMKWKMTFLGQTRSSQYISSSRTDRTRKSDTSCSSKKQRKQRSITVRP